jgi:hypothetical protein
MGRLLKPPITVGLDQLYLDPNNPRLARDQRPGYADTEAFFTDDVQAELERQLRNRYRLGGLMKAILGMGWLPVDALLVWEPPQTPGRYLVVEGNTRVVALRTIRRNLESERKRLLQARALDDVAGIREASDSVERHIRVVEASMHLSVSPVEADTPAEMTETVPPLLGVRHLAHAQEWGPWAINFYLLSLYRQLWADTEGASPMRLDDVLLARVATTAAMSTLKTRWCIQSATAFLSFRAHYKDRLPEGETIVDNDQAFFSQLLEPGLPRERFGIHDDDLTLRPEMEEVLFCWAFSRLRHPADGAANPNVLRGPDDIRLWNRVARYDAQHHTTFAQALDPARPEQARRMAELEVEYLAHRCQQSPIDTLRELIGKLKRVDVGMLRERREEIVPLVEEVSQAPPALSTAHRAGRPGLLRSAQ